MVSATLALVPYAGWIYAVLAAALGAWFLAGARQLKARVAAVTPRQAAAGGGGRGPPPDQRRRCAWFDLFIAYLNAAFAAGRCHRPAPAGGTGRLFGQRPPGRWNAHRPCLEGCRCQRARALPHPDGNTRRGCVSTLEVSWAAV